MSNEKRSDNWISQLNELENLPGESSFNKTAAWDSLHQRLDEKKHNKRAVWYCVAAASLLIAAIIPFLHQQAPERQPQANSQPSADKQTPAIAVTPVVNGTPAIVNKVPVAKEGPVVKRQVAVRPDEHVIIPQVAVIPGTKEETVTHQDTVQSQSIAATVTPHKMRVVHINDVGGDVIGNAYVYPEHKQFKIAISGPAGFASQLISEKTIKTDLSPKN